MMQLPALRMGRWSPRGRWWRARPRVQPSFELPKPAAGMPLKSLGAGTPTVELCGGPAAEATKPPIDAGKAQVAVLVHAATVQRLASEPEAVSGQQKAAGDGDQAPGRAQLPVDAQVRSRLRR